MRCIKDIIKRSGHALDWQLFDVRGKAEVPGQEFDLYISTGVPGSPTTAMGYGMKYYDWLQQTWDWNQVSGNPKKHVFFICHSFQMAVKHFRLAEVTQRKSMSFGTFAAI